MLTDRDPNASGRTSRASNLSARSRATYRLNGRADKQDLLASAPGVMSMLRTSTEMGNIAGLTGDMSGMSNVPRAPQRRGTSSRLSTASSMSGTSSRASRHHRQYPSSSSAPRRSSTREPSGPQYIADTLSPTVMDLPGSSPLIPMRHRSSRNNRDSQRSFSMTNTIQPTSRLSSNRSLGSLRSHELIQRPKSPYVYPTRLRRPSYRPASPALSDVTGPRPQRLHGHGSQGQIQHSGVIRMRTPSDTSLGYNDRASGIHRRPSRGHPPVYYNGNLPGDVPPVPPLSYARVPLQQPRVIKSSLKGSFSSGSTSRRNDSDAPSSEQTSPPTPRDGSSLEVLLSQTVAHVLVDIKKEAVVKDEVAADPLYYDYSEQFERDQILEPEVSPVLTGFVENIKTIQEERSPSEQSAAFAQNAWNPGTMPISNTAVPGIVELPASPVARRITREMILEALGRASTTEDVNDTGNTAVHGDKDADPQQVGTDVGTGVGTDVEHGSVSAISPAHSSSLKKHFSILSQADSSVINSSTLDFAVRCSIPIVTGTPVDLAAPPMPKRDPPLPPDSGPSTEADMSDLLAGYQHTESKQSHDIVTKEEKIVDIEVGKEYLAGSWRSHAPKSSDPQSFKSATDVLESEHAESELEEDDDAKSYKSCPNVVMEKECSNKEFDAHSFKTAQDMTTPGRSVSVPPTEALSFVRVEAPAARPASKTPLSTPAPAVLRKSRLPPRESSLSLARLRASSKLSNKHSSVSVSGSESTLSVSQQAPAVPPRESSASKEAERSMRVASWMLLKRWTKKATKDEEVTRAGDGSRDALREVHLSASTASSQRILGDAIRTPEKALFRETLIPRKPLANKGDDPASVNNAIAPASPHQPALSSSGPVVVDPSSVYSSKGGSIVSRVHSSPAGVPKIADNRRDSQTTTHLAWHGRRSLSLHNPAASISEPHLPLPSSNDDTTTNLRLSQYRYHGGHYLPDLKEESHEDSSLNTSASNLKNSNFRFPFGKPGGVRRSVDDEALFSRRSSMGSHRKSAPGSELSQAHELPSMRFSRMDLYDKVEEVVRLRSSRSLDHVQVEALELHGDTPPRPVSAREMREKYRSFCDRLDQLNTPKDAARTEINDLVLVRRAKSPEYVAEIEQVTIPSVNGLTERLSEMLPSLREYYKIGGKGLFVAEEMIMEHAMEDIHEVGGPAQKRSSARLRPMPGSPNMVVIEDALYEELTNKEKENDSAVAQGDEGVVRAQGESRASETGKANSSTRPKTPIAELASSSPTLLRPRALTVDHRDLRASVESGLTTRSLRSFASTPTRTDTRPWNSDKNYPWATTTIPSVDISLPPPVASRHSPRPGPSHLRNKISDTSTVSTFTTPVRSPFGTESDSTAHARRLQRFSQFGRNGGQSHEAGERYPNPALTPSSAIIRDDFSTYDTSDDDAEPQAARKGKFNLKKRFSSHRNATFQKNARAANRSRTDPAELASPESDRRSATSALQDTAGEANAFNSNRHTFRDAQGMPSVVYHRHRFIDHLKRWWHKGGDLIRSLSRRSSVTAPRN